jgi:NADPH-dependent curcumin reductase CurA
VVRNLYLSVEPAMRGWVSSVGNHSEPVPIGGVMRAFTVGRIVERPPQGPRVERYLLVKRARMQGFLILDCAHRYPKGIRALTPRVKDGLIRLAGAE